MVAVFQVMIHKNLYSVSLQKVHPSKDISPIKVFMVLCVCVIFVVLFLFVLWGLFVFQFVLGHAVQQKIE